MAYTLTAAASANAVAEREYAVAPSIQFTPISSCVGVVGKVAGMNQVFAVHLSMMGSQDEWFSGGDAANVATLLQTLGADPSTVILLGQTAMWNTTAQTQAGYRLLVQALAPNIRDDDDGVYGVSLSPQGLVTITTVSGNAMPAVTPPPAVPPGSSQAGVVPSIHPTVLETLEHLEEAYSQQAAAASQAAAAASQATAEDAEEAADGERDPSVYQ
ncbi:MAG: hypothetical protein ACYDD1_02885 [Caulobacteraceae bacterium]